MHRTSSTKRRYHHLLPILYHSKMLSPAEKELIPRTTRQRWNKFSHEDYYGYEMVKDYIADFDHIKEILTNKHLKQGVRLMYSLSYGYRDIIKKFEGNKKLLRQNSDKITFAITRFAKLGKINLSDACKIFGVDRSWFYRHRNKSYCSKSINKKCFRQYPNQLTYKEVENIDKVVNDPINIHSTKTSLFYQSYSKRLCDLCIVNFFQVC